MTRAELVRFLIRNSFLLVLGFCFRWIIWAVRKVQRPRGPDYCEEGEWAKRDRVNIQIAALKLGTPVCVTRYRRRSPVFGIYEGIEQRGHPPMIRVRRSDGGVVAVTPKQLQTVSILDLVADAAQDPVAQ